ncbi:type II toxin-antitoxin system RelE/ParE family toxin [Candidatus Woesebacteria bacterium]|nr:type II toxin-antitoxin system RelE/ParE family toxin [Candidatus Woesebacteria bacterium]
MSADTLVVQKSARKKLHKLPAQVHRKIIIRLRVIKENPLVGAKLHGELSGFYKLRVGDYRIVYEFDSKSKTVIVLKIEHRQGVYR